MIVMKDVSHEKVLEAVSIAGTEIQKLEGNPEELIKERKMIIFSVITGHLRVGPKEPLFNVLKKHIEKNIIICPD